MVVYVWFFEAVTFDEVVMEALKEKKKEEGPQTSQLCDESDSLKLVVAWLLGDVSSSINDRFERFIGSTDGARNKKERPRRSWQIPFDVARNVSSTCWSTAMSTTKDASRR